MMKLYFIRHLKTKGNYERRYIGRTDESLYEAGKQTLPCDLPMTGNIFASPMRRCLETVLLWKPDAEPVIVNDLREMDFGDFENKCYEELKDNPDYRSFIDSNGNGCIPNGENTVNFKRRCCKAFLEIIGLLSESGQSEAWIVCHGGTIMSIMEAFEEKGRSFYDYQVKNGSGYETVYLPENGKIKIVKELM